MNGYGPYGGENPDANIPAGAANYNNETPPPTTKQLLFVIALGLLFTPYVLLVKCFILFLGAYSVEENISRQTTPAPSPDQALALVGVSLLKWSGIIITLFLFLILNLSITAFRYTTFFGHQLWKWCLLTLIFSISHILTNKAVMIDTNNSLKKMYGRIAGKSTSYYVTELLEPVISVLTYGSVLLGWLYFFRGQITPYSSDLIIGIIDGYGTMVVVLMFVRAVVRLLNTAFLLIWKSKAIFFNEFAENRVLKAGFKMFFVYTVLRINPDTITYLIQPFRKREIFNRQPRGLHHLSGTTSSETDVTTEDLWTIAQFAQIYTSVMPPLTTEAEHNEMRASCRAMLAPLDGTEYFNQTLLQERLNIRQQDSELLFEELRQVNPLLQVSYTTFEDWIVNAYKECTEVGKHIVVLENMVVQTNRILIANLMIQTFLTWLFLTGRRTTKVIVVIPAVFVIRHFFSTIFSPECELLFKTPSS